MIDDINKAITCLRPPKPVFSFTKSSWSKFELSGKITEDAVHEDYDGLESLFKKVQSHSSYEWNKTERLFEIDTEGVYDNVVNEIMSEVTRALQQSIFSKVQEPKRTKLYKWLDETGRKYRQERFGDKFIENYYSFYKFIQNNSQELRDNGSTESKQLYAMAKFIKDRYEQDSTKN